MLPILALACVSLAPAALPDPDPARLRADLECLCSPDFTGRETGTAGCTLAAAYVAEQMRTWRLEPIKPGGLGGVTLASQFMGSAAAIVFALVNGFLVYGILSKTVGIRLDPEAEMLGADLAIHNIGAYPEESIR